jgi:arylsulfatase A-like enzyme
MDANRDRTVANLDIAPTLMDALGLALPQNRRYAGYDLFAAVPHGRVSVSVSNNEWRAWHLCAFGVVCEDDRLVFHQEMGLMYFDIRSDPAERNPMTSGSKFDTYRAFVMLHPTLPKWLNGARTD